MTAPGIDEELAKVLRLARDQGFVSRRDAPKGRLDFCLRALWLRERGGESVFAPARALVLTECGRLALRYFDAHERHES